MIADFGISGYWDVLKVGMPACKSNRKVISSVHINDKKYYPLIGRYADTY